MKKLVLVLFIVFFHIVGFSQSTKPTNYLSKEFHKSRRDVIRSKMPENSIAVIFANPIRNRANDVDDSVYQSPDRKFFLGTDALGITPEIFNKVFKLFELKKAQYIQLGFF